MKLEFQVCSLEQAKKLDGLGLIQKSLYYHNTFYNTSSTTPNELFTMIEGNNEVNLDDDGDEKSYIKNHRWYCAYTTAELLKINNETITLNYAQLSMSALAVADHLIGRIERGEFSVREYNEKLLSDGLS